MSNFRERASVVGGHEHTTEGADRDMESHGADDMVPTQIVVRGTLEAGRSVNFATFFLSTGRCGTQWIATSLADEYSDQIAVEHEPLHRRYEARNVLGHRDVTSSPSALPAAVLEHMDWIEGQLETRSYVECGYPNWSTIPHLAHRFRGRARVIHLTRHPVPTCSSWLTHRAFAQFTAARALSGVITVPGSAHVSSPWSTTISPFTNT